MKSCLVECFINAAAASFKTRSFILGDAAVHNGAERGRECLKALSCRVLAFGPSGPIGSERRGQYE